MKKLLVMFSAAIFMATSFSCSSEKSLEHGDSVEISLSSVATGDNSQNSLDWKGVYKGVLPCADCEGIETTINLKSGGTFKRIQTYLGKKDGLFADEGTFQWDEKGSKITLYGKQGESQMYLVGENALFHLDKEGNRISGDLAPNYILPKNPTDPRIEDKKWIITELRGNQIQSKESFKEVFLQFEMETATVSGNGSCNNIFGPYELKEENQITFGNIASTMMACPEMEMEKTFLEILREADNYSVTDSTLSLNKAKMAPLARFSLKISE
ncbi:copper resistance protein NlpE N-terminal domain-containing protein [Aquiflexum sp. LQ15W]|uniref:copper resistance protein NlpE N-terminal domain-containing protein n=1 Tax=Cognataquiflexum nitidum TaxID=2922272 RepID=UPI001F12B418|nr:copper resistance protein NlpE N-terminal domain-containing protein [Cognataquiflexum nitidum]MCH6201888.1 copper resistance protein NlpE N-terminal domain-containing protein [Cognataquiflexum nitidum]